MIPENYLWLIFAAVFLALMFVDMGVINRGDREPSVRKASASVALYIAVALLFGLLILFDLGEDPATSYYAAYLIELSMSVDNLFVFIVIFGMFQIPPEKQHRVLFWGIVGAIVFRAAFIIVGAELLSHFDFMMYVFGAILIFTAFKTTFSRDKDEGEENGSLAFRLSRHLRATSDMSSGKFFVMEGAKRVATPLFLCLVVIEVSDLMFAFDSIPAALSISTDIFIVYASNIFAVLGLRSIYFVIKELVGSLRYLKYGLGAILFFIGIKMFLSAADITEVSVELSLLFIVAVLLVTILASVLCNRYAGGSE